MNNRITDADTLYDSESGDALTAEDLGISQAEYDAAIAESLAAAEVEGHIRVAGRRVYAAE
jgi:hypothetical protein